MTQTAGNEQQQMADALVRIADLAESLVGRGQVVFDFQALADGTALADFSNGASATPGYDSQETGWIRWNNHTSHTAISGKPAVLPRNFDGTRDATLTVIAGKTGATDADDTTFDITLYATKGGDAYDADTNFGATTPAMVGTATAKTLQQVQLTLAAADLPDTGPVLLTCTIKPTDGTLATDDLILATVMVEFYTKPV